jgi:hypothetical protein
MFKATLTVTIEINPADLAVYTEDKTLAESVEETLNNAMPYGNVTVVAQKTTKAERV